MKAVFIILVLALIRLRLKSPHQTVHDRLSFWPPFHTSVHEMVSTMRCSITLHQYLINEAHKRLRTNVNVDDTVELFIAIITISFQFQEANLRSEVLHYFAVLENLFVK